MNHIVSRGNLERIVKITYSPHHLAIDNTYMSPPTTNIPTTTHQKTINTAATYEGHHSRRSLPVTMSPKNLKNLTITAGNGQRNFTSNS